MKLNYSTQLIISCVVIIIANIISTLLHHWIYRSIGWILCGILWIVHPTLPQSAVSSKGALIAVRIAGIILILIGIFARSYT